MYSLTDCGTNNVNYATADQISAFQSEQSLIQSILSGAAPVPPVSVPLPGQQTSTPAAIANLGPAADSPTAAAAVTPGSPADAYQTTNPGTPDYLQPVFLTLPECYQTPNQNPLLVDCCSGYPTGTCAQINGQTGQNSLWWAALAALAVLGMS